MTTFSTFEGQFWTAEDNNFEGFERLSRRMKDGKHMYDEISDFIQKRIKIEQDYGKALQNLGKSAKPCTDTGTSKTSWENVKLQTVEAGRIHIDFAGELKEHVLTPANDFREQQRVERKQTEETMARVQKAKVAATDKLNKAERKYNNDWKAVDDAKRDIEEAMAVRKGLDKLTAKVTKCEQTADAAQQSYKESVRLLNDTRIKWEREMEKCEKQYQSMEITRLEHQRNAVWLVANIASAIAVEEDKKAEEIRQGLERMNPAQDLHQFVEQHRMGAERPVKVVFRQYGEKEVVPRIKSPQNRISSTMNRISAVSTTGSASGLATEPPAPLIHTIPPDSGVGPTMRRTVPISTTTLTSAVAASAITKPVTASDWFKATFNYQPQGPEELSLAQGEKVRVLDKSEREWWKVKKENGRVGMCPASYLKPF